MPPSRLLDEVSDTHQMLEAVIAALPGGEDRPQQRAMVDAVMAAFASGQHLAVQGPTGVGKSLGYLLPAIARSGDGHRTVVVTSSKALQDQLGEIDLPFLASVLGVPFDYAVLKGRSNYLCQAALAETSIQLGRSSEQSTLDLDGLDDPTLEAGLAREIEALLDWSEVTTTGELAELDRSPSDTAWAAVSVGPGECVV